MPLNSRTSPTTRSISSATGAGSFPVTLTTQRIIDISITDDGRYVAVGFSNGFIYFTDKNGNQLWRQSLSGPISSLRVSGDGSLIFATTGDKVRIRTEQERRRVADLSLRRTCGLCFLDVRRRLHCRGRGRYGLHVRPDEVPRLHCPGAGEDGQTDEKDDALHVGRQEGDNRYVPSMGVPDDFRQ